MTIILENGERIEVNDKQLKQLIQEKVKKTGYELDDDDFYCDYYYDENGIDIDTECNPDFACVLYENANYYSDKTVAENNIRADKLMRQLRRFAVEHRETELDWLDDNADKYYIAFNYKDDGLFAWHAGDNRQFGIIYFDSYKTAQLAIDTFKNELTWYFKEYKDSL